MLSANVTNLAKDFQQARVVTFSSLAGLVFLVWEFLINLSNEIQLIWRAKFTYITVLYAFVRFYGLAFQIALIYFQVVMRFAPKTRTFCTRWMLFEGVGSQLEVTGVECLMVIRAYAVCGHTHISYLLVLLFILQLGLQGGLLGISLHAVLQQPFNRPGEPSICASLSSSTLYSRHWIPAVVFETLLCGVTLSKVWPGKSRQMDSVGTLLKIYFRDSIVSFVMTTAVLILSVVWCGTLLSTAASSWISPIFSCVATRLLLSLRSHVRSREQTLMGTTIVFDRVTRDRHSRFDSHRRKSEIWMSDSSTLSSPSSIDTPVDHNSSGDYISGIFTIFTVSTDDLSLPTYENIDEDDDSMQAIKYGIGEFCRTITNELEHYAGTSSTTVHRTPI